MTGSAESTAYFGVSFLFVEIELVACAAIVYLDEVEPPFSEIETRVLFLVTVEAGAKTVLVIVIPRTAGVCSGVRIYAGFEAERMDMVGNEATCRVESVVDEDA